MSNILIGFDGGGTYSRFIVEEDNEPARSFIAKESLKISEIGVLASAKRMFEYLMEYSANRTAEITALAISLSGAGNVNDKEKYKKLLREFLGSNIPIYLESDSLFTLRAAYPKENDSGFLIIAGTGSVILAKKQNGETKKIGGWGKIYGDEGSGYWIGVQALKHYCEVSDGTKEPDVLSSAVKQFLIENVGKDDLAIRSALSENKVNASELASLVAGDARDNDTAYPILQEGAVTLAKKIQLLHEKVGKECDRVLTFHGGVLQNDLYQNMIMEKLSSKRFVYRTITSDDILKFALLQARELV